MNVAAIMIGKHNSIGMPGKNTMNILGRPLCEYPLIAASESGRVCNMYVSTDSPEIMKVARRYKATVIERPPHLLLPENRSEHVYYHAYESILAAGDIPDMVCLLYANAPFVTSGLIDEAVDKLSLRTEYDSCIGVYRADTFAAHRSIEVSSTGDISPSVYANGAKDINSDRSSGGGTYFVDTSLAVARSRCLDNPYSGTLPFVHLGKKRLAIEKDVGFDLDEKWQVAVIIEYLKSQGFGV